MLLVLLNPPQDLCLAEQEHGRAIPLSDIGPARRGGRACAISRNGEVMEYRPELEDHSGLMPANLITLPHFSVSSTIRLPTG
jgi:hypothetical protein